MKKTPAEAAMMFPDDLRDYIDTHKEGSYQLIDVRQPEEYEENRIPGSKILPLPLLAGSLAELDKSTDTIVYCAVGGRSLMAARFLAARGFERVYQLQGGIEAWEDRTAAGPAGLHLQFIRGDESAIEAARIAHRQECGLERFHQLAMEGSSDPDVRALLEKLVQAEKGHVRRLEKLLDSLGGSPDAGGADEGKMEGGFEIEDFLTHNREFLKSSSGCLELAMMIEVQALDLYLQMAQTCTDQATREVFNLLADEEKAHLNALGKRLGSIKSS